MRRTVMHVITGLSDGGAEAALYNLCRTDTLDRHHVVSLTNRGKYAALLEKIGVQVTHLDMPRSRPTLAGILTLIRTIRSSKPDAVQTWMYHSDLVGGVATRFAGYSNLSWGIHHSDLAGAGTSRTTVMVAKICSLLSRSVPRNIVCCAVKSAEIHRNFGYDPRRIHIIPNGYDLSTYRPDPASRLRTRTNLSIDLGASVIGFVARYDPLKDHETLLKALSILLKRGAAPTCLLVGTGMDDRNDELVSLIATLGLAEKVRLLGRRSDVPDIMNVLDLHVMSSVSEAFPNVLAEAMASGTPCVSTDVGDAADILGDTGWIVPIRDPAKLAEAIEKAIKESLQPAWPERQVRARERIEANFSIDRMVNRYRTLWFGAPETDAYSGFR